MAPGASNVEAIGWSRADRAMERYADGDDAAFSDLYDRLAPRLFRFALRWTRSRSAAEDAVQQTLLQIHAARRRFARGTAVIPWAYAIARRILIDAGRRGRRIELRADDAREEEPTSSSSPEEEVHWRRLEEAARADLVTLPLRWREVFTLLKLEGFSVAEVAEVLGVTQATVKVRAYRATTALRRAIARREGRDERRGQTSRAALRAPCC